MKTGAIAAIAAGVAILAIIGVSLGTGEDQQADVIPIPESTSPTQAPTPPAQTQQQVPAPGFEDVPEMIVESENSCDPSYPDVCIAPYPPDLDCDEIFYSNFRVVGSDPHGFDADNDGIGCEVGSPVETTPSCDPSYPDVCIPPYPPDLDCGEIGYSNFRVEGSDPHGFDRDNDGIGCES